MTPETKAFIEEMKSADKLKEVGAPFEHRYDGANYYSVYNNSHELVCRHFEDGDGKLPQKFIYFISEAPQLISDLCDRLEVAKKALEFYADIETLTLDGKPFLVDKGKIAREALEAIK